MCSGVPANDIPERVGCKAPTAGILAECAEVNGNYLSFCMSIYAIPCSLDPKTCLGSRASQRLHHTSYELLTCRIGSCLQRPSFSPTRPCAMRCARSRRCRPSRSRARVPPARTRPPSSRPASPPRAIPPLQLRPATPPREAMMPSRNIFHRCWQRSSGYVICFAYKARGSTHPACHS